MSRHISMIAVHEGHQHSPSTDHHHHHHSLHPHHHPAHHATTDRYSLNTVPQVNTQDFLDLISLYSHDHDNKSMGSRRNSSHGSLFVVDPDAGITPGSSQHQHCHVVLRRMQYLTCVAALGGFLSGYNTGVISGALLPLTRVFDLTPLQEESIVSATILAAFLSSLVLGGILNHCVGRKRTILTAAVLFVVGSLVLVVAPSFAWLVVGEVVLGIGIGLESLTNPMYIAELSKPTLRGMLVSAYAWMMCFGQFFAGMVDGVFGPYDNGWRFMFGTAVLPGTLMFVGFWGLPESPAWLLAQGHWQEATGILKRFRDTETQALEETQDIQESLRQQQQQQSNPSLQAQHLPLVVHDDHHNNNHAHDTDDTDTEGDDEDTSLSAISPPPRTTNNNSTSTLWHLFCSPSLRRALIVGCSLMVLQQFCGANVVMYYSATVYRRSGFSEVTALWLSAVTALAQLIGLALSLVLVETAGRRPLVLVSFFGVALCLFGLGVAFYGARVTSPLVDRSTSDAQCLYQPALVWNGISKYCLDCTMMEGCGYCGGACLVGDRNGPTGGGGDCPAASTWHYEECDIPTSIAWMPVVLMVLYLIVFGVGAAGLPWTINSELYPVQYRSLAVAISTGMNWLCNLIISSTFLTISDAQVLTLHGSFWLYSFISLLGVVWLYLVLPETKGLSPEKIEQCFATTHHSYADPYHGYHERNQYSNTCWHWWRSLLSHCSSCLCRRPRTMTRDTWPEHGKCLVMAESEIMERHYVFYGSTTTTTTRLEMRQGDQEPFLPPTTAKDFLQDNNDDTHDDTNGNARYA